LNPGEPRRTEENPGEPKRTQENPREPKEVYFLLLPFLSIHSHHCWELQPDTTGKEKDKAKDKAKKY